MGLVGAISALAAPSAATVTGTVVLDKDWYNNVGTVKITVTDADLNVKVASSTSISLNLSAGAAVGETLPLGTSESIVGAPDILLSGLCTASPRVLDTNLKLDVFSASGGTVNVSAFNSTGAISRTVCYDRGKADTTTVTLKSTSETKLLFDTPVTVTETGVDTSKFEVTVTLVTDKSQTSTTSPFKLFAQNGDTVTVTYTDAVNKDGARVNLTDTAMVETNSSLITGIAPSDAAATQDSTPEFKATLNDSDSGVDIGNVYLLIDRNADESITYDGVARRIFITGTTDTADLPEFLDTGLTAADSLRPDAIVLDKTKTKAEADDTSNIEIVAPIISSGDGAPGSDVIITFVPPAELGAAGEENQIAWYVVVFDKAGNVTISDSDPNSSSSTGKPKLLSVDEPHVVRVDRKPPDIVEVLTGKYWDPITSTVKSNKKTSIQVKFTEKLDSLTVSASDFIVDGLTPLDALVFSSTTVADLSQSVFLTVSADMAPDAKPKVAVVTGISDPAGNTQQTISAVTSKDGIAPTFTVVTVDKTLTNKGIRVDISSDESLSGNEPTVELYKKGDTSVAEHTLKAEPVPGSPNTWKAEQTTTLPVPQGKIAVYVTGVDQAQNTGTKGRKDTEASGAIVFTFDTLILTTDPAFDPVKSTTSALTKVFNSAPFLRATYSEKVTITKAEFGLKSAITLTDVTSQVFSSDGKTWVYAASGLTIDSDYQFKVDAQDLAGNTKKGDNTEFTVKERAKVKTPLVPGSNMVSLPGQPTDSSIGNVGLPAEVTAVLTYDAASNLWLVATRGTDGTFSGTLTTMDATRAYWVETTGTAAIEVDIPPTGASGTLPPVIPVAVGWNLLPIVVLNTDTLPTDITTNNISADLYFGSIKWVAAYWFNTAGNTWVKALPKQIPANNVQTGKGYWVYVNQAGALIP